MGTQVKYQALAGWGVWPALSRHRDSPGLMHVTGYWNMLLVMACLYAAAANATGTKHQMVEVARDKFFFCQIGNVSVVDDANDDINTVALALTSACISEYDELNRAIARYQIDNSNERRMFKIEQNSDALKRDASRRIVEMYRLDSLPEHRPR